MTTICQTQLSSMNISRADAIAHLAKWYGANTEVRAVYRTMTGTLSLVGKMKELSVSGVTIAGNGCEMRLFFRDTSEYEYKDAREPATEGNKDSTNKYPTIISVE